MFEKPHDKSNIEILHKEDINTMGANTQDINTGDMVIGNKKQQTDTIVKLTEAGMKLLNSPSSTPNNLHGRKEEICSCHCTFQKGGAIF